MASGDKKQPEKRDNSAKSEIMRRFKTNPLLFIGTVIVLVIVIIAFVFVPAMPDAQGGGELIFGSYNKVPIKYVPNNYFYQALQILTQRQQPAPDDPNYMSAIAQIWRSAFEETVIHLGIMDEMKQAGFVVPEDVVDREMAGLPHFQENGRFSSAKYRAMDNATRMNLRRQVEESVVTSYYISDSANLRTASKEASFVSSMASPRRSFDLAVFPLSSYPDSEMISYAEANPELVRMLRFSMITVSSEREGRQILDSVKSGTVTFEEAAQANSRDWAADRGGDAGSWMGFELAWVIGNEQARESVFGLAKGELTDLYQIPAGWAFYRVDEEAYPADLTDMSLHTRLQNYFMQNLRGRMEDWAIAEAEKFSALVRERGFDEAVSGGDITRRSFGPIPLNYGNSSLFASVSSSGVTELANAGTNQFFWRAAFSTPLRSPSSPLVIEDNVIVLFPLEEVPVEDDEIGFIESYYPYWMRTSIDTAYRSYFMNNGKLNDRFMETFTKVFWSEN